MNLFAKIGLALVGTVIALIPTWIFLLMRHFLSPVGFWQNLVTVGLGYYLLGGIQLILLIILVVFIVMLVED